MGMGPRSGRRAGYCAAYNMTGFMPGMAWRRDWGGSFGCPVISAVLGANLALIVAEPTIAGVHDMRCILHTVQHFGVRSQVAVNKADVYSAGTEEIESFGQENGIQAVGRIPFDLTVASVMVAGEAVTAYRPEAPASSAIRKVWERVVACLLEER